MRWKYVNKKPYWLAEIFTRGGKTKKQRKLHFGDSRYEQYKDRTKLQKYGEINKERRSYIYNNWRKEVQKRDGWKCKINNKCSIQNIHHF